MWLICKELYEFDYLNCPKNWIFPPAIEPKFISLRFPFWSAEIPKM